MAWPDKPPHMGLASQYTMGIHPQNVYPWYDAQGGGCKCASTSLQKNHMKCFSITSLPPINALVVKVTTLGYELNLSLFS